MASDDGDEKVKGRTDTDRGGGAKRDASNDDDLIHGG